MSEESASYRAAGVDYDALDAGKRLAMAKALSTSGLLAARGGRALDSSRGEPAFVFELDGRAFAFVVEGLGTKSIVARQVLEGQGINRFADVAYDTVAAILNDLGCVGALPLVVNAYFATGASEWYRDTGPAEALLEGWRRACADAGCTWGGGESPSLPGLLDPRDIELAGAAVGVVPEGRSPILGAELAAGDEIVLVASSGLHANGASLARLLAGRLSDGYATRLAGGETLGEALLEPSIMYVPLLAAVLEADLPVTYISHVTGHGLLKLMRPPWRCPTGSSGSRPCLRCSSSSSRRPASTTMRLTRRSTWEAATRSTAPPARRLRSSRSPTGWGSTRSWRGASRKGRGRSSSSRSACASPARSSSCRRTDIRLQSSFTVRGPSRFASREDGHFGRTASNLKLLC